MTEFRAQSLEPIIQAAQKMRNDKRFEPLSDKFVLVLFRLNRLKNGKNNQTITKEYIMVEKNNIADAIISYAAQIGVHNLLEFIELETASEVDTNNIQ